MRNILILISISFVFSIDSFAALNVEELNKKLNGVGWVARESRYNHLSQNQKRKMFSLPGPVNRGMRFQPMDASARTLNLPTMMDWRNVRGRNFVSPILDQGSCGSCVAFSSVAVLETQLNISNGFPGLNVRLSPQSLFSCGGGACEMGWWPSQAMNYLKSRGVPDEACFPYASGATGEDISLKMACKDMPSRSYRISSTYNPTQGFQNIEAVKAALLKGPLLTTMHVYEDFMVYSSGVYKHVSGGTLGGHAVTLVGYDDSKNAWIIRNSWGADWGDQGYVYIDYDDTSGIGLETWGVKPVIGAGAVSIQAPGYYQYFKNKTYFAGLTNFKSAKRIVFGVSDAEGNVVSFDGQNTIETQPGAVSVINTSTLADGRYYTQAMAVDASGNELGRSSPVVFYVANAKPTMSITFKGINQNLGSQLKGDVEIEVLANSLIVPMGQLEFHLRKPDDTEKVTQLGKPENRNILGWDTKKYPNGRYEIWFLGAVTTTNGTVNQVSSERRFVVIRN